MDRRIKAAKFPLLKTLDSFDFTAQKSVNEPLVRELLRCEFIDKNENVLLIGNSGTGKTHLATALGFAACCQGYKVRFFGCTALVTQLLEAREERQLQRLLTQLQKQDLLILDHRQHVDHIGLVSDKTRGNHPGIFGDIGGPDIAGKKQVRIHGGEIDIGIGQQRLYGLLGQHHVQLHLDFQP